MLKICIVFLLALLVFPGGQVNASEMIEGDALKAGMPSPDFKYRDVSGKVVKLQDLKGRYVYIDVWATWCGPCCGEIPHLKKLEKEMHGKKIVFVSISCDKDRQAWIDFVKKNQMGGIQLNTEGNEDFMSAYGIKGIPRFILLDKKGKIINADMTRPSQPETLETLSSLKGI